MTAKRGATRSGPEAQVAEFRGVRSSQNQRLTRRRIRMRLRAFILLIFLLCLFAKPERACSTIRQAAPGIYCGGQLRSRTDYEQLQRLGVKTVVDLRVWRRAAMQREQARLASMGIRYIQSPIGFTPQQDGSPEQALRIIADPRLQPVYVHCNLGKDRAGLEIALYRTRYQGWQPADADREMQQHAGRRILRRMEGYIWANASPPAGAILAAQPDTAPSQTLPVQPIIQSVRRPLLLRRF